MKRRWIAFCIILILALTGCKQKTSQQVEKQRVAFIMKSTKSAFWKSVYSGANAAANEYHLLLSFEGPDTEEDYLFQNELICQAVDEGASVIVLSASDYDGNVEGVEYADANNVPVIVIDSDVNSDCVKSRIETNNYKAGCLAGEAVLESKPDARIGIVNFDVNTANGQEREKGVRDTVAAGKKIKLVDAINVLSTREDAKRGTITMLKKHPDINMIVTFNEWTTLGVGDAIRTLDMADKTTVIAFDSNVESVDMLESGEVDALIVQNPYAMGYLGVENAYKILNNLSYEENIDTSTTLVTRENMYTEECQKALFAFEK
ncbi:MAG: substrate-binding domain-containing protein [Lachnospiraceae bacterium]